MRVKLIGGNRNMDCMKSIKLALNYAFKIGQL